MLEKFEIRLFCIKLDLCVLKKKKINLIFDSIDKISFAPNKTLKKKIHLRTGHHIIWFRKTNLCKRVIILFSKLISAIDILLCYTCSVGR